MPRFHPDLQIARVIPPIPFGPRSTALMRARVPKPKRPPEDLFINDLSVPGQDGALIPLRLYRPRSIRDLAPVLLWIHGGGMISGHPLMDERTSIDFARTLGITVAAVDYRLAPDHPAPTQLEDCYSTLLWLQDNAEQLGIDVNRMAIGGASAGGGLTAGIALMAHDRGDVTPMFQLLVYPMIDDRTVNRADHHVPGVRMWSKSSNRYGWTSYLGRAPGGADVSPYAAPARRIDLSGLPPAWVGVGTFDLFHDEDVEYARRLREAGVPCSLDIIEGAFHGFDAILPRKPVSRRFWRAQAAALHAAFWPEDAGGGVS